MLLNSRLMHRPCLGAAPRSRGMATIAGPLALVLALGSPMGAIAAVHGLGDSGSGPKQQPPTTTEAPASCREIIEAATFTGRSRCVFENGDRYDGSFAAGQLTGTGRYTYSAGGYYEGELRAGVFQGRGVFESAEGHRYEGDFVGGQFQGRGVYVTAAGDRYEGQFSNNTFDGQGTYTYADGRSLSGRWQAGQLVESATEPDPNPEPDTNADGTEPSPENDAATPEDGEVTGDGEASGEEPSGEEANGEEASLENPSPEAEVGALQPTALDGLGRDRGAAALEIATTPTAGRPRRLDVRADALKPPLTMP
jgi:hypothetical protein